MPKASDDTAASFVLATSEPALASVVRNFVAANRVAAEWYALLIPAMTVSNIGKIGAHFRAEALTRGRVGKRPPEVGQVRRCAFELGIGLPESRLRTFSMVMIWLTAGSGDGLVVGALVSAGAVDVRRDNDGDGCAADDRHCPTASDDDTHDGDHCKRPADRASRWRGRATLAEVCTSRLSATGVSVDTSGLVRAR
jgi:hypothetical protein